MVLQGILTDRMGWNPPQVFSHTIDPSSLDLDPHSCPTMAFGGSMEKDVPLTTNDMDEPSQKMR